MSRYQLRMLVVTVVAVVLLGLTTFFVDWFTIDVLGAKARISLHSMSICDSAACVSQPLSGLRGAYAWTAMTTFWCSILLLLVIGAQTAIRVFVGIPNERLARVGVRLSMFVIVTGFLAGYVVAPDAPQVDGLSIVEVHRTLAPLGLVLGAICTIVALRLADTGTDDAGEYKKIVIAKPGPTSSGPPVRPSSGKLEIVSSTPGRSKPPTQQPPVQQATSPQPHVVEPTVRLKPPTQPPPNVFEPPAVQLAPSPPPEVVVSIRPRPASVAPPIRAANLPSRIRYATLTVAFSSAGLTAARQDGLTKLVKWESIVGIVARRLPAAPPYDGAPFVDIVSSAGSTLRILPTTEISGHTIAGSGVERARALVQVLALQCLDAALDPATKAFSEGGLPAQLPDEKILAAHDERLA